MFDNMTADNFEHRNLPYGMVPTIFFDFWGVNLSEESFIAPPRAFYKSFLNLMLSHIFKPAQEVSSGGEEDVLIPEPYHTFPPPVPLTDPYSTLSASLDQIDLSHKQFRDDFYFMTSHFAAS